MKIAVIGTGYVGLVAGACFADAGNTVVCVDKDLEKIQKLHKGEIPIYEPGLEDIVKRAAKQGHLLFTTSVAEAVSKSEIIFFAVGTPTLPDGSTELSFLKAAVCEVAHAMDGYRLLVNKSTVPIGTFQRVAEWVRGATKHPFDVVSNPEFLKEGTAVDDFLKPDRVVIGALNDKAFEKMVELYSPFVRQGNPILRLDPLSAEVAKYACNSFLATRISFMNELSGLCEKIGADIEQVRKVMTGDGRIGKQFLYPGVGYGGSCFPKDVKALLHTAQIEKIPLRIVAATEEANAHQKTHLVRRMRSHFVETGGLNGKIIALLGLAFKPNTDDIREAPALAMIEKLLAEGALVRAYDPVAMDNVRAVVGDQITYCSSPEEALQGADALALVTEWNLFRNLDWDFVRQTMRSAVIFDGRNIYSPERMREHGFVYYGIGRS